MDCTRGLLILKNSQIGGALKFLTIGKSLLLLDPLPPSLHVAAPAACPDGKW